MKKIISIFIIMISILFTGGCYNKSNMEDITIYTTSYPIEYIVNRLYGEHSEIKNIYPEGVDINNYKITNTLLKNYNDIDLYVFNGLSNEKNYIKTLLKNNKELKIIDGTSSIKYDKSIDELWLDPAKLLTVANNIKKGFNEYISATYLNDEINENYENLKIDLTDLDAKYRSTIEKATSKTIIVSSDSFNYLNKYGLNVISLDGDVDTKTITETKTLINNGSVKYIFIKKGEEISKTIKSITDSTKATTLELNTLANLNEDDRSKYDYLNLSTQNLETLKEELYK